MATFRYKAVTSQGDVVENKAEALSRFELIQKIKENNLSPISVVELSSKLDNGQNKQKRNIETSNSVLKQARANQIEKSLNKPNWINKLDQNLRNTQKVKYRDIVVFTQNLFLLKRADFNNIHALATVIQTIDNFKLKKIVEDILLGVEAGDNMYVTMEYYSSVFPPIYINIIKVGELSGSLTDALERAVDYLEKTESLNKKIKGVLIPNLLQFIALMALAIVGTLITVPMIQNVLDAFGSNAQLPAATMAFSNFIRWFGTIWYIPVVIIAALVGAAVMYINTPKGRYNFHLFKYKMPIFGSLIYAIDFSRLIQSISLNLRNGQRVQDALETSKNISNNLVMSSLIESAINNLLLGQSWIQPFKDSGLSTPMITEMLEIGMQTDLAEMMEKLDYYMQIDIDNILERVIKILPQIVAVFIGLVLIFVVVVVLAPLIEIYMGGFLLDLAE